MKKLFSMSVAVLAASLMLTGCNCFKSTVKRADGVQVKTMPEVLTLKGTTVTVEYDVTVPEKFVSKKGTIKMIPVLVYNGQEQMGVTRYIQGEKVKANNQVVTKDGAVLKYTDTFKYNPEMLDSRLELRFEVQCKEDGEYREVYRETIAEGTSAIQELIAVASPEGMATAPDKFQRVTVESQSADIMFEINRSNVRRSQLTSEEIKTLEQFIADNTNADRRTLGKLYSKSYASPDGPLKFNNKLSEDRSKSTKTAISRNKAFKGVAMDFDALGEDWDGFRKLVEASDIADKNLILQVLNMYSDPEKRDEEIKNMTAVFDILKVKILPELRRSHLAIDVEVQGLTDEELMAAVSSDINKLNLEEMLFAATLYDNCAKKAEIYKAVAAKYPNDFRAYNNLAKISAIEGNAAKAREYINKAAKLNAKAPEVITNMGVIAMMEGNYAQARKDLSSVNTPESRYSMSVLEVLEGNYDKATSLTGYNKAVLSVLRGNLSEANVILSGMDCPCAKALSAVVEAKQGNQSAAQSLLNEAKKGCGERNIMVVERELSLLK